MKQAVRLGFRVCHKRTVKLLDNELYEILGEMVGLQVQGRGATSKVSPSSSPVVYLTVGRTVSR